MLKESLVYIRKAGGGEAFVGCGAFIEQNLIVTCRHVWRDTGEQAEAVFPHIKQGGGVTTSPVELIDPCKASDGEDPDVVLLRATDPPEGLTPLQIARGEAYETGQASALARLPTRKIDREIPGSIGGHIDEKGRRAFSQPVVTGYWLERGSSGSPIFVGTGQQLAGIVSMAELGDEPQNAPVREAYVVPGTVIWPFVRAVAQRELDVGPRAIQQALERESQAGDARELIFEIARRSGGDAASFDQALANARAAFEEGQKAIKAGAQARNLGPLVEDLLEKLGERTGVGDFDAGAAEADRAFAEWEKYEAGRRAESVSAGKRILEEGARQDILRRNFAAAAKRYARIVDLESPDSRRAALRARQDELYIEGRDRGVNASLEVAIELARLAVIVAREGDDRLSALNDLGLALTALGERETGTARLEEAVRAYRAALRDKRVRAPLDRATTQNNLGLALWRLGERENGKARLEEAAAAFRAALQVRTRERLPFDWAETQNNLGNALSSLAERESGTARLNDAVAAYRAALEVWTRDRAPLDWAMTQSNLGATLRALGEQENGTARFEEAVAAIRAALEEWTRDQEPFDWAMAQYNLGDALMVLGEREGGTARLEEAIAAYRAALEEWTHERVPLDWAASFGSQGVALALVAERTSNASIAETAVRQIEAAYEATGSGVHEQSSAYFEEQLAKARAIHHRLKGH